MNTAAPALLGRYGSTCTPARRQQQDAAELDVQAGDFAVDDADGAGDELLALVRAQSAAVREVHDIAGPLPDELDLVKGVRRAAEDAYLAAAYLEAVAVRAVEDLAAEAGPDAGDVGQLVDQPVATSSRRDFSRVPSVSSASKPLAVRAMRVTVPRSRVPP